MGTKPPRTGTLLPRLLRRSSSLTDNRHACAATFPRPFHLHTTVDLDTIFITYLSEKTCLVGFSASANHILRLFVFVAKSQASTKSFASWLASLAEASASPSDTCHLCHLCTIWCLNVGRGSKRPSRCLILTAFSSDSVRCLLSANPVSV